MKCTLSVPCQIPTSTLSEVRLSYKRCSNSKVWKEWSEDEDSVMLSRTRAVGDAAARARDVVSSQPRTQHTLKRTGTVWTGGRRCLEPRRSGRTIRSSLRALTFTSQFIVKHKQISNFIFWGRFFYKNFSLNIISMQKRNDMEINFKLSLKPNLRASLRCRR